MTTVPTFGTSDQVTAVFVAPLTDAVNCCDWPAVSDAVVGDTLRETVEVGGGVEDAASPRFTAALTVLVGSAALVAITVTVCAVLIVAGAV